MDINEITETIGSWDNHLSPIQKKYIHYNSFRNFILYFPEIPGTDAKEDIVRLLEKYITDVKENDFYFDANTGLDLANKYMTGISNYYSLYLNFKSKIKITDVLIWGFMGDSILYLTGFSKKIAYVPIIMLALLSYYILVYCFKERKNKVYGLFY